MAENENDVLSVNPLKEKSDQIEFTVDKMGLNTPAGVIPTDVDFFLRKKTGNLEPKYTFSEAFSKALDIDNLFFSSQDKLMKENGPPIDVNFIPTQEMFSVIEKKLHRLNLAYMEETMRRKINYFYPDRRPDPIHHRPGGSGGLKFYGLYLGNDPDGHQYPFRWYRFRDDAIRLWDHPGNQDYRLWNRSWWERELRRDVHREHITVCGQHHDYCVLRAPARC